MKNTIKIVAIASLVAVQLNAVPVVENVEFIQTPLVTTQVKEKSIVPVLAQVSKTTAWTVTTLIATLALKDMREDGTWGINSDDLKSYKGMAKKWSYDVLGGLGVVLMVGNIVANVANTVKKIQDYRKAATVVEVEAAE